MSETPDPKLSELVNILVTAIPLVTHLDDDDAVRRGLFDTLLTAQMRDPARRAELARWLLADPLPDEMPDVITTAARLNPERLRIVPKVVTSKQPLAQGTCVHARPVRYNLSIGYARHADGDRTPCDRWASFTADPDVPPAYAAAARAYAEQTDRDRITARCHTCGATFEDPDVATQIAWLRAHERDHHRATVDPATVATDVDARARVCNCHDDDCGGDCAGSRPPHNGHYGVPVVPGWPENGCPRQGCESFYAGVAHTHPDCAHPWHTISTPDGEPLDPQCPACGDVAWSADPSAPVPPGIRALPDGDTRDWPADAIAATANMPGARWLAGERERTSGS